MLSLAISIGCQDSVSSSDPALSDSGAQNMASFDSGSEVADSGHADLGIVADATVDDAGPEVCSAGGTACPNGEVCLGEECSCIVALHGNLYLRTDGTVVSWAIGTPIVVTTTTGATLTDVTEIYDGSHHGCALRSDSSVWCWPSSSLGNATGQLGNGSIVDRTSTDALLRATAVLTANDSPLTNAAHLPTGSSRGYLARNTCAVMGDGSLRCWGSADSSGGGGGTLFNDGVPGSRPFAVEIMGATSTQLTGVTAVSLGARHACVIRGTTTPQVWCWGANIGGPLGQGDQAERQFPVQVILPDNVDQVGAGADATCARVSDGVYCWGSNTAGQLGIGDRSLGENQDPCINLCKLTPTQVVDANDVPLAGVESLDFGYQFGCARRADHSLWCWGLLAGSASSDWAIPAEIDGTAVNNIARQTTFGSSSARTSLRYLTRDNVLYRASQAVSIACP